jgi:hypothetical protein
MTDIQAIGDVGHLPIRYPDPAVRDQYGSGSKTLLEEMYRTVLLTDSAGQNNCYNSL